MNPRQQQILVYGAFLGPCSSPVELTWSRVLQARMRKSQTFLGASEHSRRPAKMGKENSNEETWGDAGARSYSRWVSADRVLYKTLSRGKRTLCLRGHRSEEHTSELQSPCNL